MPDHMIIRFYPNLWSLCSSSAAIIRAKGGHIEYKIYEELLTGALQKWKVEWHISLQEYNHHLQTTGCRMSHFVVRAQKITSLWASHTDRHNVIRARVRVSNLCNLDVEHSDEKWLSAKCHNSGTWEDVYAFLAGTKPQKYWIVHYILEWPCLPNRTLKTNVEWKVFV